MIEKFDPDLKRDPTQCKFKIAFEDDESELEDLMSYNDILDYVERECNNEDGDRWNFREILSHSILSTKKER